MSPRQIAKLAREWFRANGANPVEVVKQTAQTYRYSADQTDVALEELYALLPAFAPADPDAQRWLHSPAN